MKILWFDEIKGIGQAEYLGVIYFININSGIICIETQKGETV
jgi:hypothetical protein